MPLLLANCTEVNLYVQSIRVFHDYIRENDLVCKTIENLT
jgi:hypothetical protein